MAESSASAAAAADVQVSYHRAGSSTRSITVNPALEHLHTIQSGIPSGPEYWDNVSQFRPQFRNDSIKGQFAGSALNEKEGLPLKTTLKRGVGVHDSRKLDVWRAAAVELVATAGFTFLSITAYEHGTSTASAACLQALIYSLAIFAASPISGGHLNPAITLTTFLTGQATLVRTILYIVAQCGGAIGGAAAANYLSHHTTGDCQFEKLSSKEGMVAEIIFTIILLFVAYGIGFDTRSVVTTFPIIAPAIIGGVFGLNIFLSQSFGYTAAMNPARCLGPALMDQHWKALCGFVFGPVIAALVVGAFQQLVGRNGDFEPVLPMTFFQVVVPDHQRPGFGPRSPGLFYSPTEDPMIPPSQSEIGLGEGLDSKYNLTLQIKAFMKPKASTESRLFDQNVMLRQYSHSQGSSDSALVYHSGHPDKER